MSQPGLDCSSLGEIIGGGNRVSEIFPRRPLLDMIRIFNGWPNIPVEVLIRQYELDP
ncbi:MAG TPA: hypothetical protein VK862_06185 [Afifellaceae bacterium]|nr:hypothetical protein [Afifellaceae bacterium]